MCIILLTFYDRKGLTLYFLVLGLLNVLQACGKTLLTLALDISNKLFRLESKGVTKKIFKAELWNCVQGERLWRLKQFGNSLFLDPFDVRV